MTITTIQIIFGLISTLALVVLVILGVSDYRRDKANITVTVEGPYTLVHDRGRKIIITAINKERRPAPMRIFNKEEKGNGTV